MSDASTTDILHAVGVGKTVLPLESPKGHKPESSGAIAKMLSGIRNEFVEAYRFRYVTISYVQMNLRVRYRRLLFGFFWSLLAPLMSYLVIGLVFSFTLKITMPNYFLYFFSGSVFYNFINVAVLRAPLAMIENEIYIKKIYVPKLNFVLNGLMLEFANFLLCAFALVILGIVSGKLTLHLSFFFLPIPILMTTLSLIGMSCLLSVLAVFFRDLVHIVPIVMQAMFFLTPVVYPEELMPHLLRKTLYLNPFYYFIDMFRTPIIFGVLPRPSQILFAGIFTLISLGAGLILLKKFENRIVFKL